MTETLADMRVRYAEQRKKSLATMETMLNKAKDEGRSLTTDEADEFDRLTAVVKELGKHTGDTRSDAVGPSLATAGAGAARDDIPEGRHAVLKPEHRYSTWLNETLRKGDLSDRRSIATDFDTRKYWLGMATGTWKNAAAEQRASMQEGVSADGGYLVPSPVLGEWIDLLRDQIVFIQGQAHTVPWESGSTLTLPVVASDPVIQNPAETVDVYPPNSDATVGRYQFIARPYAGLETISWELLEDSAVDISQVITQNLAKRMAVQMQTDFIYGAGATTIQGFTGASGLLTGIEGGSGTNGAAPASSTGWNYVDMGIEAVRSAKVEPDLMVSSPRGIMTYGRLKNSLYDALRPSPAVADFLNGQNGKRVAATTAVKDTQTVGSATSNCSDLFIMDSSRIYWAVRHDFSVMNLKERFATQRLLGVMVWQRVDAVLTHAEAAYWLKGIVGS